MSFLLFRLLLLCLTFALSISNDFCDVNGKNEECGSKNVSRLKPRYIFYDINPPEGFNLRRDVYMRMAVFARKLKKDGWYLVLPPWPHLYHWRSYNSFSQSRLPWSLFFDVEKLSSFAPVIEMSTFLQTGQKEIDQVYVLQHFEDTFTSGNFNDRMKVEPCQGPLMYERIGGNFRGDFWGYGNLTAKKVECLSFHGSASLLKDIIKKTEANTIMFDHAEVALHDRFGDKLYWDARRSMKFAKHLIVEAAKFRKAKLNSSDETDGTVWPNSQRNAVGGDYVCVHLRRRDFLSSRMKEIPTIKGAAKQIEKALKELNLKTVFVATDCPKEEKVELKSHLQNYNVVFYKPTKEIKSKVRDGGVAIIDQIICSHARKFYGTHESTFSFRIQEEREIMGFEPETTFNRLCGDKETKCRPPSKWLIVN